MAYGKIKADAIIYDDSGSDVEKSIAALATAAPTANPTFTGDITFTGASGANVVFDASENALQFATNAELNIGLLEQFVAKATGDNAVDIGINEGSTVCKFTGKFNSHYVFQSVDAGNQIAAKFLWDNTNAGPVSSVELYFNNTKKIETTAAGVTVAGSVTDDKGDLRTIVQVSKSAAHTIVAADSGKHSINSTGGWTFNTSTGFTAGQAITLINNSGSDQTITNTGCTMYLGGDTSSKSTLTLKGRGIATFICTASNVYYGSGAGLE